MNSLIALDATTGRLAWYQQFIPHDVHDYDVMHVGPIFKAAISGSTQNVVASTGKNGILRLLDRDSADILYSVPFTNRVNVDAGCNNDARARLPREVSGVTTTEGDLIFAGELSGDLLALDAQSGNTTITIFRFPGN
jgi:glucose dehydrogenase